MYLYCLGAYERWKYCICNVWGLTGAGSTVFVVSGAQERWKYSICRVWGLTGAGSIVCVVSGGFRALEVLYL